MGLKEFLRAAIFIIQVEIPLQAQIINKNYIKSKNEP
jgi:hypothetical protein